MKRQLPHISQPVDKPISYSQEDVNVAKIAKGVLKKNTNLSIAKDYVIHLLAVEDDHVIYKLQSLAKREHLCMNAQRLLFK